jgi:hypothetical protein
MSVEFTLTSKTRVDQFIDTASIGDATLYKIDCTPWEEDNETITDAVWTPAKGVTVGVTNPTVLDGVLSATLAFTQAGRTLIAILFTTASGLTKKIWLEVNVKDVHLSSDDYGLYD